MIDGLIDLVDVMNVFIAYRKVPGKFKEITSKNTGKVTGKCGIAPATLSSVLQLFRIQRSLLSLAHKQTDGLTLKGLVKTL